jgi:hypothetical protein
MNRTLIGKNGIVRAKIYQCDLTLAFTCIAHWHVGKMQHNYFLGKQSGGKTYQQAFGVENR